MPVIGAGILADPKALGWRSAKRGTKACAKHVLERGYRIAQGTEPAGH